VVVVLEKNVTDKQLENVIKHLEDFGFAVHKSTGVESVVLGAIGVQPNFDTRKVKILEGVAEVYRITEPFKLASRSFKKDDTHIRIKDVVIGGKDIVVMAGPCSIESEEQIFILAEIVSEKMREEIREKMGAAYSYSAYNNPSRAYPGYGIFYTQAAVNPDEALLVKVSVSRFLKPAIGAIGPTPVGVGKKKIEAIEPGAAIKDALLQPQSHGSSQTHLQVFRTRW